MSEQEYRDAVESLAVLIARWMRRQADTPDTDPAADPATDRSHPSLPEPPAPESHQDLQGLREPAPTATAEPGADKP
jgi:hypothetical protein